MLFFCHQTAATT